jgi:alkylhydroperoxidase/carboxymuconolactone decarboxylase family protein YurZ
MREAVMDDGAPEDAKAAKRQYLYERYNNRALDTGHRLQGDYFFHRVEEFDQVDPEFTQIWLTWVYDGMYNRQDKLDEKTRILVVLGECCVLGAEMQLANHMRSAMRAGASPEEIREVILQSHIYGGVPRMVAAMKQYRSLMGDLGLLEVSEPAFRGDARE